MIIKTMTRRLIQVIAFASVALAWVTPALAHSVNRQFGDFYGGMLHPMTAVEHLFPIIGLSLLAGQQGPQRARWVVFAFPTGLFLGAIIAIYMGPTGSIVWVNRVSFVVLGVLVAVAVRVPLPTLIAVSLLFGLTLGFENISEISRTITISMFLPGVLLSGLALVAIVAAIAICLKLPWQQIVVRVAGSWIAAIGLLAMAVID